MFWEEIHPNRIGEKICPLVFIMIQTKYSNVMIFELQS